MLHAVGRRDLQVFKFLDDLDVVGRACALDRAQQFARRHVAVVGDVSGHRDRPLLVGGLPLLHEFRDARQRQLVIPGGAEHAEQAVGRAPYVRPVLLVVDPGRLAVELELGDLLAQRLDVVAADRGRHNIRLRLLDLQQIRREVTGVLRHQQIVHDLAAGAFDLRFRRSRRGVAPHVIVGEQHPVLADGIDGVLDRRLGEIGAVAVPDEFDARTVFAGLAGRRGVGVEVDHAVLGGDLGDGVGDAGMHRADQDGAVFPCDETLGDAAAGRRRRFGVGGDPGDLAPEHAAFGVGLVDRHLDAAQIVLAAVAILAAGVAGQAELDRLGGALRPDPILLPGAEITRRPGKGTGHQAALENASPRDFTLRHGSLPTAFVFLLRPIE